jgi:2'-5' RNA ligase
VWGAPDNVGTLTEAVPFVIVLEKPDQLRLFIAVATPEGVMEALEKAQSELRRAVPGEGIRWTRREQFHLTLKFLGNVRVSQVEELKAALGSVGVSFESLHLVARGLGFFPAGRAPRVVWAGVNDSGGVLVALWKAIELATRPFSGEEPEERFTGHITLGRVNRVGRKETEELMKAARHFEDTMFGEWVAGKVELMRSELSSQGARHSLVAAVPLKG